MISNNLQRHNFPVWMIANMCVCRVVVDAVAPMVFKSACVCIFVCLVLQQAGSVARSPEGLAHEILIARVLSAFVIEMSWLAAHSVSTVGQRVLHEYTHCCNLLIHPTTLDRNKSCHFQGFFFSPFKISHHNPSSPPPFCQLPLCMWLSLFYHTKGRALSLIYQTVWSDTVARVPSLL